MVESNMELMDEVDSGDGFKGQSGNGVAMERVVAPTALSGPS